MTSADATLPGSRAAREVDLARDAWAGGPRRSPAGRAVDFVSRGTVQIVLGIVAVVWLVPAFGLLVASLRGESANNTNGWWNAIAHPAQFTVHNYKQLIDNGDIIHSFWNTVIITVSVTVLVVLIAALAGYAFAWMDFPGRDWAFLLVVGLLVVPLQVALIPVAKLYSDFGIFGSLIGVIGFHIAFGLPFAIFLLRNFFSGIPRDLLEAARMDGATELRIFARVVLPLGLPAVASLAIFQFLWTWNDLLVGLIFAGPGSRPLTVAIQQQTRTFGNNIDVIASAAFLSMVVPLAVFFAFQRYFVQGVLAGSVK
jgi:alpha-glucoside transport system permease protein